MGSADPPVFVSVATGCCSSVVPRVINSPGYDSSFMVSAVVRKCSRLKKEDAGDDLECAFHG